MVEILEKDGESWDMQTIDVERLESLADDSLGRKELQKDYRGDDTASVVTELPLTDCYVAPCVVACPYIRLSLIMCSS